MKRLIAATVLALSLSACGNAIIPADSTVKGGTAQTRAFVTAMQAEFMTTCKSYDVKCDDSYMTATIVDGDLDIGKDTLGVCYRAFGKDGHGKTVMLKNIQFRLDELVKMDVNAKALVFHEQAHCVADAEHFDTELDIMGTFAADFSHYDLSVYVARMFTRLESR